MPKEEFLRLMKNFKNNGGKYIADEESERYLDAHGAEACTLNETTILFRKHPTRSAVYEELFHVEQFRMGKIDGKIKNRILCEIDAQNYLIDNAEELGLTSLEIIQTKKALFHYQELMDDMKGEEPNDNM